MTAAMASLKSFRHGGANLKFISMMGDIREHVNDWYDRDEVAAYIEKIVNKEAFDRTGLVYGMGHAVYTLSDPRERILKEYVKLLVREKGMDDYFALHENIEAVAPAIIAIARIVGRSAHRLEEIITSSKIIRPAYKSVMVKSDE